MADKKISALTAATTPLAGTEVLPIVQGGSTVKVSVDNLTAGKTVSAQNIDVKLPFYDPNGNPRVMTGVSGADPYLELDRWTGAGTNFGAMRLSYDNSIMSIATSNYANIGSLTFTTRMQISNTGNITANTGNFVVGTAGKGIDFSANANAPGMTSELLNWYEEGNWTPTATSASGTITTYTSSGRYTRVGNLVYVTGVVGTADIGTASGKMTVGGLPFAGAPNYQSGLAHEVINTGTSYFCALANGATSFTIQTFANGGITWGNASQYHFSFVYRV